MRQTDPIPFGSWEPDAVSIRPSAAFIIRNVMPIQDGYAPLPAPARAGTGVPDPVYSAAQFIINGSAVVVAGTADSVFKIQGENRSTLGAGFIATEEAGWGIELFDDWIVVSNVNDGILKVDSNSGTLSPIAGAPKAKFLREYNNFLFAGQVSGYPCRLQWSGYSNLDTWEPDAATQSDFQDLSSEHGDIRGISGSPYMTVYQRTAITRCTFVGGATVFRFDTLERNKGLLASGSLVSTGKFDFFLSEDGFNVWDGRQSRNIDEDRIKNWFESNCTESNRYFVRGAVDFRRKMIFWTWPDSNFYLGYSYLHDKWVQGEYESGFDTTGLFPISAPRPGIDLDTDAPGEAVDLDAPDALPDSYDHPYWRSGSFQSGFLHGGDLSLFTGSPLKATLESSDIQPEPGRASNVHQVWPIVDVADGSLLTSSVGAKPHKIGDAVNYSTDEVLNSAGYCPVRASGRFFRARVTIPAGETWNTASGVHLSHNDAGMR